ncbi:uncharacterized protein [Panulirus ornatus]|uniref:uncharacterized protein n=1 Tax=Panulirus ornatus TaxID=150431 RepID=UPI003A84A3C5
MRNLCQAMPRLVHTTLLMLHASHLVSTNPLQCNVIRMDHNGCSESLLESNSPNVMCRQNFSYSTNFSIYVRPGRDSQMLLNDSENKTFAVLNRTHKWHHVRKTTEKKTQCLTFDTNLKFCTTLIPLQLFIQGTLSITECDLRHVNTKVSSPSTGSSWTYIMIGIIAGTIISCTVCIVHKTWQNHRNGQGRPQAPEEQGSVNVAHLVHESDDLVYDDLEDTVKRAQQEYYHSPNKQTNPSDDVYLEPIRLVKPIYENLSHPLTTARQNCTTLPGHASDDVNDRSSHIYEIMMFHNRASGSSSSPLTNIYKS